jgi:arylsulfatase A-like enzyme
VDLLPTLAQIAGAKIPNGLDGETMEAAWLGKPVVRGTPLYFNDRPGWSALREKQWKAHWKKGTLLLFDVMNDPSESENVAKEFPELSEKYMKQLKQWEASIPIAVKK